MVSFDKCPKCNGTMYPKNGKPKCIYCGYGGKDK